MLTLKQSFKLNFVIRHTHAHCFVAFDVRFCMKIGVAAVPVLQRSRSIKIITVRTNKFSHANDEYVSIAITERKMYPIAFDDTFQQKMCRCHLTVSICSCSQKSLKHLSKLIESVCYFLCRAQLLT